MLKLRKHANFPSNLKIAGAKMLAHILLNSGGLIFYTIADLFPNPFILVTLQCTVLGITLFLLYFSAIYMSKKISQCCKISVSLTLIIASNCSFNQFRCYIG